MRKLLIIMSISSLIVLGGYSIYEYTNYTLEYSESEITTFIHEQFGPVQEKPLLLEAIKIEDTNKVVATFEYNQNKLGAVIFQQGLYGNLKFENILLDHTYYSEILDTNKGTYILFIVENLQTSVKTIETDIVSHGDRVKIAIPPQKYYTHFSKMENVSKINTNPIYIYRTLKGAITSASNNLQEMELMFVDENHQSFLIYSEKNAVLKTVLGSYQQNDEGYTVTGVEEPNFYSMNGEKSFCFEEKKVSVETEELIYLHGLVPQTEEVQKVILEVEKKEEVIYQISSDVVANQFFFHISVPEVLESDVKLVKKFHLYDKEGNYIRTEMKS
ncbi:hypothetical protein AB685_14280 [Bacillus sp. LL01]|uniref:hypothetical protein n=1 Tax=Bacillus sp. LL01 TaxID=1665556 RepID=UPI00064D3DF9|nr:hypothetical protein [Bacillus sp. LL01]KMJ57990.1 hypothetical protein AB685_14280 [Bacillus sp. LL01]